MGQAKLKKNKLKEFMEILTPEEKIIFDLSQSLIKDFLKKFELSGWCYRMSILFNQILEKEYNIKSDVIVGYICDGDDVFISHAWVEYHGKKIDLTAGCPGVVVGKTIILDYEFRGQSNVIFSYHLDKTEAALQKEKSMVKSMPAGIAILEQKEEEHQLIKDAISSTQKKEKFLEEVADGDGFTYDHILTLINLPPHNDEAHLA